MNDSREQTRPITTFQKPTGFNCDKSCLVEEQPALHGQHCAGVQLVADRGRLGVQLVDFVLGGVRNEVLDGGGGDDVARVEVSRHYSVVTDLDTELAAGKGDQVRAQTALGLEDEAVAGFPFQGHVVDLLSL